MSFSLRTTFLLLTLLGMAFSFQSCKTEGCTDPNAENYNVDADTDNGSCTYARTKFIGRYGAGEACGTADATGSVVDISESSAAFNALTITNETLEITVTGFVTGNSFTIDDSAVNNGVDFDMKGNGVYTEVDGAGRIDIEYTLSGVVNGQAVSQTCIGVWLKG